MGPATGVDALGHGAVVTEQGHADHVGGRLDGQQGHRRHLAMATERLGQRPPSGSARRSPDGSATVTPAVRRRTSGHGQSGRAVDPVAEHRLGGVPPFDQGHAPVLHQLARDRGRRSRAGGPGGRRRRGAASGRPRGPVPWPTHGVLADQGEGRAGHGLGRSPRPAPKPWAKVVLPAPRSPDQQQDVPGRAQRGQRGGQRPGCRPADGGRVQANRARSRVPSRAAAWPGPGRPASRPPPPPPTAARPPGGRSAPAGTPPIG